ncbi:MAG TPA: peptidoglycan-binding protein [Cytophagales bacterium]|nr:peptidoglycan-binding protein [Cytophagales bacterium]HCR52855.1 peptidoglycan-binding protein [Cytophagales bacterium]
MTALKTKYQGVISRCDGFNDLKVVEQNNMLYITGNATSEEAKQKVWDAYTIIDPDMRAGDLVLDIKVVGGEDVYYEVQKGDTLGKIAKAYPGISWKQIYEANTDIIKNPNLIYPGQKFRIPRK